MTPRQLAIEAGEKSYEMTSPCKRGHLSRRLVSNNGCMSCNKEKLKTYRKNNPGKASRDSKVWRTKNPSAASESSAEYYRKNKEAEKARTKAYRQAHMDRYRELERQNNKAKVAKNARRRAQKLQATPPWLTKEHLQQMKDMYKNCPVGYEVDHIYPLMGETSCGLHVPWNLQYLTHAENRAKGNRLP